MTSGLILVDIQNEYFPGGRLELALQRWPEALEYATGRVGGDGSGV